MLHHAVQNRAINLLKEAIDAAKGLDIGEDLMVAEVILGQLEEKATKTRIQQANQALHDAWNVDLDTFRNALQRARAAGVPENEIMWAESRLYEEEQRVLVCAKLTAAVQSKLNHPKIASSVKSC